MMKLSSEFVTVVLVYKEYCDLNSLFLDELCSEMSSYYEDYEILIVDLSRSERLKDELAKALQRLRNIRCLHLASSVSRDVAYAAGIENSIGDYVVLFSPDQDPVGTIFSAVEKAKSGFDIVVGVSGQRNSVGYRLIRPLLGSLLKYIGYSIPRNSTDFRCLSRKAVNAVSQMGRFHHKLFVRMSKTGYCTTSISYESKKVLKKSLIQGVRQGFNLLVFNSTAPLRWMSVLGASGSFMAFIFASYSLLIRLFRDDVIEGWTSTMFVMSFLFMLLFVILAFFGEYLGRLLDDRSEYRDYVIASESNSSVMLKIDRLNVVTE